MLNNHTSHPFMFCLGGILFRANNLIIPLYLTIIFFAPLRLYAQNFTTKSVGKYIGLTSIADIDNDGDIDFLANIRNGFSVSNEILENNNFNFTGTSQFSRYMFGCFVGINNDNYYDLFFPNYGMYENKNGQWTLINNFDTPTNVFCFTDFNLDNSVDIILVNEQIQVVEISSVEYLHTQISDICDVQQCVAADFDNDGQQDLLLSAKPKICENNNCTEDSVRLYIAFQKKSGFHIECISKIGAIKHFNIRDFNNDFDKDILFCSKQGIGILLNNNGKFSLDEYMVIEDVESVYWFNSNGNNKLSIFYTLSNLDAYIGQINSFVKLPYKGASFYNLGDFDNDGDIDLLTNSATLYSGRLFGFFINNQLSAPFTPNTPPEQPSNLQTTLSENEVIFNWNASTDNTTPQAALTYNMYVGTQPNKTDIMSPLSDLETGWRKIVEIGNIDANTGWKLRNLPCGTYYWSVQAIDNSYAGGQFATEATFTIPCGFTVENSCSGNATIFKLNSNDIKSALWNFGDNQTTAELSPTHIYKNAGKYTVSVEITYTDNSTETITKEIEIFESPKKPKIMYNE